MDKSIEDRGEQAWIDALIAGDAEAYRRLIREYHGPMRQIASAIAGGAIADEVVQEAWMSVMRALPKFEGRSSVKTWLTRIVVNEAKTRLRKEKRYASLEAMGFDEPDPFFDQFDQRGHWSQGPVGWHLDSPERLLSEQQLNECVERVLELLPPVQKTTFILRELQGMDYDEICNVLDVTASNVRVLLHRAKAKLLKVIEHYQETGECCP